MKASFYLWVSLFILVTVSFGAAEPTNEDTTLSAILDIATLLLFLLALLSAFQLYIYMKGGSLVSSWRWLTGAAIFFAVAKMLELAKMGGTLIVTEWLLKLVYLVAAIFLATGFSQQRKLLS